jgi:HAD superfamily hydrolase (TIGR01544 family)
MKRKSQVSDSMHVQKMKFNDVLGILRSNANIHFGQSSIDKLKTIFNDGSKFLHLVTDFDMTVTKNYVLRDGKLQRNVSAHGMFIHYSKVPAKFRDDTIRAMETYMPIEFDMKMTEQEKIPYMIKWWTESHELIKSLGFTIDDLKDMIREMPVEFRKSSNELFDICKEREIPMLIFSAGIANIIELILEINNYGQNDLCHVLSNRMEFDKDSGVISGFKDPLLHVFNKNEGVFREDHFYVQYSKQLESKDNVILIGDGIGDSKMAEGMQHKTCLKIGLLNSFECFKSEDGSARFKSDLDKTDDECTELLDKYQSAFDIVVTGDIGFDEHLNIILRNIQ